uniref:type VI secretion system domain-containing protein n=1 Tax=uncultured Desulfovibrio sp. TaxID=167968 RepID=UPI00260DFBE9
LAAALDMLEGARRQAGVRSARAFPLRIEQTRLLLAAGHAEAAVPLAEELEETIARHDLADWQDTLSLDALRVCHSVWSAGETPDARQRAAATAAALCRLRPSRSPFL